MEAQAKTGFLSKGMEWIQKKGYSQVKSTLDGHEEPKAFQQVSTDATITPDFTAKKRSKKHYFEIVLKTNKRQQLISKLKLLSRLAALKNGKLFVFAPHGHKTFARNITRKYQIPATVISI